MKKLLFVALAVAGMTVFASCDKDDNKSDEKKGREAAKVMCECYQAATTEEEFDACEEKRPDMNSASPGFLYGWLEVMFDCEY